MTIKKKKHSPKIVLDLTGPQGNAFVVLGTIRQLMRRLGYPLHKEEEVMQELMSSDYEHLIKTADEYFGDYVDFLR